MIGLGSNRLSVCRRGGMSVTQAGRGGMEWLAGGRVPDWITPYSAQATAALKAQFPTQWPTIRDYGFAHPEIVGYMNAYAPEDAKIAYSLVEGIGTRWLVGDGVAYINTGVKPYTGIIMKVDMATLYDYWTAFGSRVNYQDKMCSVSINTAAGDKRILVDIASVRTSINMSYQQGDEIEIEVNDVVHKATIGGTQYNIPNVVANNVDICVFALNNNGSMMNNYASKYREFEIVGLREYLPMKLGKAWAADQVSTGVAQAAGTCGMIDLVSGIFYPNANSSGSFTISETPAA